MTLIKIGKIVNTHGIKGELRLLSKFPYKDKVFINNMTIYIDKKDKEIINLFNEYILPQFKNKSKIKIINDDAFNYFKKDIYYDYVFVDIWHDPSDGIDLYLKFKSLEKNNIKYSYWIEDTLKCYIE